MNAYLEILRPTVCLMTVLALVVGGIVSQSLVFPQLIFAILAGFLITGGGNIINDYFDVETDRINSPNRPIPSGRFPKKFALPYFAIVNILGLVFAYLINTNFLLIAVVNFVVSTIYSWKLKTTPLVGNIAVSYLGAVSFFAAGLISMSFSQTLAHPVFILAVIGFFGTLAREILKDIRDVRGDKAIGAKTLPIITSEKIASIVANVSLVVGILLLFIPFIFGMFKIVYLASLIPAVLVCLYTFLKPPEKAEKFVKLAIFLVFLAFILGSLVQS